MTAKVIDWETLRKLLSRQSKNFKLIDVREPSEYTAGSIPSSINIPLSTVPSFLSSIATSTTTSKSTPLVFYCFSGVRSGKAADLAVQQGFTDVMTYKGSYSEYSKLPEKDKEIFR
jgi:rhodanese-related sulfurtransferase